MSFQLHGDADAGGFGCLRDEGVVGRESGSGRGKSGGEEDGVGVGILLRDDEGKGCGV